MSFRPGRPGCPTRPRGGSFEAGVHPGFRGSLLGTCPAGTSWGVLGSNDRLRVSTGTVRSPPAVREVATVSWWSGPWTFSSPSASAPTPSNPPPPTHPLPLPHPLTLPQPLRLPKDTGATCYHKRRVASLSGFCLTFGPVGRKNRPAVQCEGDAKKTPQRDSWPPGRSTRNTAVVRTGPPALRRSLTRHTGGPEGPWGYPPRVRGGGGVSAGMTGEDSRGWNSRDVGGGGPTPFLSPDLRPDSGSRSPARCDRSLGGLRQLGFPPEVPDRGGVEYNRLCRRCRLSRSVH